MKALLLGLLVVLVLAGLSLMGTYNNLVSKSQAIDGQWSQVEVQYQRRFDLIPNLVESVKGFMVQEKTIFDNLAKARQGYAGAQTVDQKAQAATQVESSLGRLLVIMENYPELKSNETVARLMDELSGTENRVSVERRRFNELVQDYNTTLVRFPTNMIAGIFNFAKKTYFEATEGAGVAPKVDLTP